MPRRAAAQPSLFLSLIALFMTRLVITPLVLLLTILATVTSFATPPVQYGQDRRDYWKGQASTTAAADVLIGSHSGDADPAAEGWLLDLAGVGTSSGPTDDGGTPVWTIVDTSTEVGSALWYRIPLTPGDLSTALSSGWRVRTELRVENATGAGETQFFGFLTGSVALQAHLKAEPNGDATIRLVEGFPPFSGPTFTVPGGAVAYHSYELVSDGVSGTASLLIDDTEVYTGYDGFPFGSANGARFGCGTSTATGTVHVKSVEFRIASTETAVYFPAVQSASWGRVKATFR